MPSPAPGAPGTYQWSNNASRAYMPPPAPYMGDTVFYLSASLLFNKVAEEHVAVFALNQVGLTADEANRTMQESIDSFLNNLSKIGLSKENVFVDMISLMPKYEAQVEKKVFNKKATEVPSGFEIKKNLHVRYKDDQMFNKIILAATKAEIYDLVKVDYFVADIDAIYDQLRVAAAEVIKDKEKLYRNLGVTIDTTYNRSVNEGFYAYYPAERYFNYTPEATVNMDALRGKKSEIIRAEKTVTQFYHPLSQSRYDKVINSVVYEPAVQFTYTLSVKYTVKRCASSRRPNPSRQLRPQTGVLQTGRQRQNGRAVAADELTVPPALAGSFRRH